MSPNINWTRGDDAIHTGLSVVTNGPSGGGSDGGGPGQGWGRGTGGPSLCLLLSFAVNLKLLQKKKVFF